MQSWPIHEAKARFSELVKPAQQQPQQLTSHGEPLGVVLSAEAYHRHHDEGESFVACIRRSPLLDAEDLDLDLSRDLELCALHGRRWQTPI